MRIIKDIPEILCMTLIFLILSSDKNAGFVVFISVGERGTISVLFFFLFQSLLVLKMWFLKK